MGGLEGATATAGNGNVNFARLVGDGIVAGQLSTATATAAAGPAAGASVRAARQR